MERLSAADVEAGLEERERMVVLVERKASTSGCLWQWAGGALVGGLLCLGLVFFTSNWMKGSHSLTASGEARTEQEEKSDLHSTLKQIGNKSTAAIHLAGFYHGDSERLEWQNAQDQAFAQGGFTLKKNRVVIPRSGLYFVYSQASYRVSCSGDNGAAEDRAPLSHRVWRYSDSMGGNATLLSSVRSACQDVAQDDEHGWYNAIYLGAAFKLNKGDELWTETSQLSQLETDQGKTFFGVFAF